MTCPQTWDGDANERWTLVHRQGQREGLVPLLHHGERAASPTPKPPESRRTSKELPGRGLLHRPLAAPGGRPLKGKRVAVIGTGSSGHPVASRTDRRTTPRSSPSSSARPNFVIPGAQRRRSLPKIARLSVETDRAAYRDQARHGRSLAYRFPMPSRRSSWQLTDAERRGALRGKAWTKGDLVYFLTQLWGDQTATTPRATGILC